MATNSGARITLRNKIAAAAVAAARRQLGRRQGIVSIHWGAIYRGGRRTQRSGIVVHVRRKRATKHLGQRGQLPSSLRVVVDGRARTVRVDVQGVGRAGARMAIADVRAGFAAPVILDDDSRPASGALGALLTHDGVRRAVFSGHVAGRTNRNVFGFPPGGGAAIPLSTTTAVINDSTMDIAWTDAIGPEAEVLGRPETAVRNPGNADVNTEVFVLLPRDFRGVSAFIDGVDATATFSDAGGETTMRGLVALSRAVTNPGDSGSPAVDHNGIIVGFVVGVQGGKTFLVPAGRAIDALSNS